MTEHALSDGEHTPRSSISEVRLRMLELTPVINCLVVDKITYERQYKDRKTEVIHSKKLYDSARVGDELLISRSDALAHRAPLLMDKSFGMHEIAEDSKDLHQSKDHVG